MHISIGQSKKKSRDAYGHLAVSTPGRKCRCIFILYYHLILRNFSVPSDFPLLSLISITYSPLVSPSISFKENIFFPVTVCHVYFAFKTPFESYRLIVLMLLSALVNSIVAVL